jgi:hypothetical protein
VPKQLGISRAVLSSVELVIHCRPCNLIECITANSGDNSAVVATDIDPVIAYRDWKVAYLQPKTGLSMKKER